MAAWRVRDRREVVACKPWFTVWAESVDLPDGRSVDPYYRIDQPDYVVIFAVTCDDRVLGIWHYKHGPRAETLGLPAGYVDPGETPIDAAQRELLEETGLVSEDWTSLGSFCVDGNRGCGRAHVFLARNLQPRAVPSENDLEECELEEMSYETLSEHLAAGRVLTLGAAAAALLGLQFMSTTEGTPP